MKGYSHIVVVLHDRITINEKDFSTQIHSLVSFNPLKNMEAAYFNASKWNGKQRTYKIGLKVQLEGDG